MPVVGAVALSMIGILVLVGLLMIVVFGVGVAVVGYLITHQDVTGATLAKAGMALGAAAVAYLGVAILIGGLLSRWRPWG